ncbi:MAG: hypothetical protein E6Q88_05935 [Lysobacteraceae bacterium]|nr:MAG: hypothetical protein E6Q88_05935 [Xanthomonadaceae bacterium]
MIWCSSTYAQCAPPQNKKWKEWLEAQEDAGGHALACHVNIGVNGLIGRIENRGGHQGHACLPGTIASEWSDIKSLISAISQTITEQGDFFQNGPAGTYTLHGVGKGTVGRRVYAYEGRPGKNRSACHENSGYVCENVREWVAVIVKQAGDDGQCFLLTAYPQ